MDAVEINKTKLHEKFIQKVSQGIIFYKQPFLPHEVKYIFECINKIEKIKEKLKTDAYSYCAECGDEGLSEISKIIDDDPINQDEFNKLKPHVYRKESINDETCLECGFPEKFHKPIAMDDLS